MKAIPHTDQRTGLSRRHFLSAASVAAAVLCYTPRRLFAAGESPVNVIRGAAATAGITIHQLHRSVSVLEGSGGNITVLTGSDGKLLVDTGIAGSRARISEALDSLSAEPVKHVVNSHWHFDHTDGNEWLHSEGAEIIAHENTRKHLSAATRVEAWNYTFPPAPKGALPTRGFKRDLRLQLNDTTLALDYYGPCHTDSDISVHFLDADIVATGDTWWNGHYPFIDYDTGGGVNGAIRAAEANIAKVTNKTHVIPGHGPVGGKSQLIEFRDMLITIRDRVAALRKQGKSLDEVIATKPTADFDAKWGGFVINGSTFTTLVYGGV